MPESGPETDTNRKVCSVRAVHTIRMIFGHYADLGLPRGTQRMLKLYCTIAPLIALTLKLSLVKSTPDVFFYYRLTEFSAYYIASLFNAGNYLDEYYECVYLTDRGPHARRVYAILRKTTMFLPAVFSVELILVWFNTYLASGSVTILWDCPFRCFWLLSRHPLQLVFSLLYCRARCFRRSLTSAGQARGASKRDHVLAYTAIYEGLGKLGWGPSLQITLQTLGWFVNMFGMATVIAIRLKSEGHEMTYLQTGLAVVYMTIETLVIFFPCIMMELVCEEMEYCKIFIADRLLTCIDKATRYELTALQRHLRSQPLRYAVWRVVPLGAGVPLALVAVGANYVICALQFTHAFGGNAPENATRGNYTFRYEKF